MYLFVCVGVRYTLVTSRGPCLLTSTGDAVISLLLFGELYGGVLMVDMVVERLKSPSPCGQMTNVSSTYLIHIFGLSVRALVFSSPALP